MQADIHQYHEKLTKLDRQICDALYVLITAKLPQAEKKVWHGHPVWFINGNPIVGYHKLKDSVRMLFWSGQSFDEPGLRPEGSFKAAEVRYTSADEIDALTVGRWLQKSVEIQWDYKNIVKNKGHLTMITDK